MCLSYLGVCMNVFILAVGPGTETVFRILKFVKSVKGCYSALAKASSSKLGPSGSSARELN